MPAPAIIFIVLIAAVVITVAIVSSILARKRRQEMAAWAQALGFSFSPEKDYSFDERFSQFKILCQGENRYAYNIITGKHADRALCTFDYHYETHSTDSKGNRQTHHHVFSAVIVNTGLPLKPLLIRPEGLFDKVAGFFGFDDIDFESAEFSRTFFVKSPDRKWAYDVIQQPTMAFLLEAPRFTLEFAGSQILAARGRAFAVADFNAALEIIEGVLARLPGYLQRELKSAPPG